MTVSLSTVSNNTAGAGATGSSAFAAGGNGGFGGGIHNQSTLTISQSTVSSNTAGAGGIGGGSDANGGAGGFGGGVHSVGTLNVTNSTFFQNSSGTGGAATGDGAGGNGGNGGGIAANGGTLDLTNVTFSMNVASLGGVAAGAGNDGTSGQGHSIHNVGSAATAKNTIFYATTLGSNCVSTPLLVDAANNLQFPDTTCVGNVADPKLLSLADNGGPTETAALQSDSPAIDTGNISICSSPPVNNQDQRGFPRPVDGDGNSSAVCDIGAFEFGSVDRILELTVDTTADVVDSGDAVNSLREAIICANNNPDASTINLPAGTYTLTITGVDEDAAANGDLDILEDLTLAGAGAASTIIQAGTLGPSDAPAPNGIHRVFQLLAGGNAEFSGVTIRHGLRAGTLGGGILTTDDGNLTLTDCVVSDNEAERGGGIYHGSSGTLTLNRTTLSDNLADKGGGLLNNNGDVVIVESTVSGNTGTTQGGGFINTGMTMSLTGSTVSGNSGGISGGGGIFNRVPLTVANSTISGNSAAGSGGGIHNSGGSASLDLVHVTITDNTADDDDNDIGDGGGVFDRTTGFSARNSIIGGNIDTGTEAPDVAGTLNSLGHNLVQNTAGATIAGDQTGNIYGQDPLLGLLANNGGPTLTHALLPGSPAIDAGNNCVVNDTCSPAYGVLLTTDQRGRDFRARLTEMGMARQRST